MFFLDPLNGGAWPLLVGGVICLVDSVNGRDPSCPVEAKIVFLLKAVLKSASVVFQVTFGGLLLYRIPCFLRKVRFWATAGL